MAWEIGKSKIFAKTPQDKPLSVAGGKWVTVTKADLPKGKYLVELQVRAPKDGAAGEAHLGRRGWGTAKTPTSIDSTGHNPIHPRTEGEIWRTPIAHVMSGGGPLEFLVLFPAGKTREIRVVAKAIRLS